MGNVAGVHVVDGGDELFAVIFDYGSGHSTLIAYEVEQIALRIIICHHVLNSVRREVLINYQRILCFFERDNVLVLKLSEEVHLILHQVLVPGILLK